MLESKIRKFQPELVSRRGEWTALALSLAASLGLWLLSRSGYIPLWTWIFWAFLVFSAVSIFLGNWLYRWTAI
jgi:hypothetical protein